MMARKDFHTYASHLGPYQILKRPFKWVTLKIILWYLFFFFFFGLGYFDNLLIGLPPYKSYPLQSANWILFQK